MKVQWFTGLALVATLSAVAQGQENKTADEPQKRLEYFVGDWDVAVQFRLPDGKDGQGKSSCHTKGILDGKFVHQEYKSKFMGQQLIVWQLLGYDSLKKKWVEFDLHLEGDRTHTMSTEGALSADGKVLTLTGDSIDGFTGKPVKMRTVTTIVDDNKYTLEWFITDSSGKEERKVMLTHVRKK